MGILDKAVSEWGGDPSDDLLPNTNILIDALSDATPEQKRPLLDLIMKEMIQEVMKVTGCSKVEAIRYLHSIHEALEKEQDLEKAMVAVQKKIEEW